MRAGSEAQRNTFSGWAIEEEDMADIPKRLTAQKNISQKKLDEEKAKLEIKVLRRELFIRPLSVTTPLIIAVAAFLFFQAPSAQVEYRGQCLREVSFLREVFRSNSLADPNIGEVMGDFPFTCATSRRAFDTLAGVRLARAEIEELSSSDGLPQSNNINAQLFAQCVASQSAGRQTRISSLQNQLVSLEDQSATLIFRQQELLMRRSDTIAGMDGTPPMCGPICRQIEVELAFLESELDSLDVLILNLRSDILEAHQSQVIAVEACVGQ